MKFLDHITLLIKNNRYFFIPYCLCLITCVFILLKYSKKDIHIWLNSLNSPFFDKMFPSITFLGDGLFVLIVCLLMLLYRYRYALLIFATFLISGILVQIMKKFIFFSMQRPKSYFKGIYDLHFVEGIKLYNNGSFPSGHSASAFALFLSLALIIKNNFLKLCCFVAACIIGYSRIYLSQHFLVDVVFGSLIGVLVVMVYSYFNNKIEVEWLERSLMRRK